MDKTNVVIVIGTVLAIMSVCDTGGYMQSAQAQCGKNHGTPAGLTGWEDRLVVGLTVWQAIEIIGSSPDTTIQHTTTTGTEYRWSWKKNAKHPSIVLLGYASGIVKDVTVTVK
ncbi:MAG: hypothetical protein RLZZ324_1191 [Candidatus Parcubacteria bacterium]|jgi:hypothetical protein